MPCHLLSATARGQGGLCCADKRLRIAREEAELRRRTELAEVEERKNTHIQVARELCPAHKLLFLSAQATRSEGQLPEHSETLWGT